MDINALILFTTIVSDRLMVKSFPESITVVAIIRLQCLGHGVGFSFKDCTPSVIIRKTLIGGCSR